MPRSGRHGAGLLVLDALVQQHRGVAAVVEDHVRAVVLGAIGSVRPGHHLVGAPPVLLERLALPGEHRDTLRVVGGAVGADDDRCGGVILGGEDVAAGPTDLGAEFDERLDQHGGLDRHVQRPGDTSAGERLGRAVLLAQGHEAGHLVFGEDHLLAAERGEREIGDAEVLAGRGCGRRAREVSVMSASVVRDVRNAGRGLQAPIESARRFGSDQPTGR